MDESVLRDFFENRVSASELARDVFGSVSHPDEKTSVVHIQDMEQPFTVTRKMVVKLCDAALSGDFPPKELQTVGFSLIASDHFDWDDELLAGVIGDWSCPEVNYPLTVQNVERFKRWLLGTESYPERTTPAPGGKLVSVTIKEGSRPQSQKPK